MLKDKLNNYKSADYFFIYCTSLNFMNMHVKFNNVSINNLAGFGSYDLWNVGCYASNLTAVQYNCLIQKTPRIS